MKEIYISNITLPKKIQDKWDTMSSDERWSAIRQYNPDYKVEVKK